MNAREWEVAAPSARDAAEALVERTTKAQGLAFHVEDPAVLAAAARLIVAQRSRSSASVSGTYRARRSESTRNDRKR